MKFPRATRHCKDGEAPPRGLRGDVVHLPRLHLPRQERPETGGTSMFTGFLPAVSKDALKRMSGEVRSWRIHLRTATELQDLAAWINPIVRGWRTYYGRYYRTALDRLLRRINTYLMRWAQQKYRRLRPFRKALRWWKDLTARQPHLSPTGPGRTRSHPASDETSGVKGDFHAPICGSPGVKFPRATRRG